MPSGIDTESWVALGAAYKSMLYRAKDYVMNNGENGEKGFADCVAEGSQIIKYEELKKFWETVKEIALPFDQGDYHGGKIDEKDLEKKMQHYKEKIERKTASEYTEGLSPFLAQIIEKAFQINSEFVKRFL